MFDIPKLSINNGQNNGGAYYPVNNEDSIYQRSLETHPKGLNSQRGTALQYQPI